MTDPVQHSDGGFFSSTDADSEGGRRQILCVVRMVQMAESTGRVEPTMYNNAPALKVYVGDSFEGVITLEIIDGLITHFYAMRNPDKLTSIDSPRQITR